MSAELKLTIDTSRFQRALNAYARDSKKSGKELVFEWARSFIRTAIALTPPGQGNADSAARKRGETAIAADLSRIFRPYSPKEWSGAQNAAIKFGHKGAKALGEIYDQVLKRAEMKQWHNERRLKDGRVKWVSGTKDKTDRSGRGGLNRENAMFITTGLKHSDLRALDIGLVKQADYQWFKKSTQRNVGFLAGGWNRAATTLGYKPPAWVRRHGEGAGNIRVVIGDGVFRVTVENAVKYANNVKGLERRIQTALDRTARGIERKTERWTHERARRAGLKTR